mmetsp:Transcript_16375/g.27708  ORF Transcript_16375/g.27708 Transcript_16375/m.27708 type:complete len:281 (-) Transcript_16375:67-909(-)
MPDATLISNNLLGLISLLPHCLDAWISLLVFAFLGEDLLRNFLKHGMSIKMIAVPVMQILDICDFVDPAPSLEDISIVGQKLVVNDSSPVVHLLEVRISKTDENLLNAVFFKIVVKCLHGICSNHTHIHAFLKATVDPHCVHFLAHKVGNLVSNLLTEQEVVGEVLGNREHEATVAAANVDDGGFGSELGVVASLRVVELEFASVDHDTILIVVLHPKKGRVVHVPLRVLGVAGQGNRYFIHGVDVRPHSVLALLGHVDSSDHFSLLVLVQSLFYGVFVF